MLVAHFSSTILYSIDKTNGRQFLWPASCVIQISKDFDKCRFMLLYFSFCICSSKFQHVSFLGQGVSRALVENSRTLRLPVHLHERLGLIRNAKVRLEEKGITPSVDVSSPVYCCKVNLILQSACVARNLWFKLMLVVES